MKRNWKNIALLLCVVLVAALSVWGPEALTRCRDKRVFDEIHAQEAEETGEGYRYTLNANERLFIVSKCLNSQILPESEQNALLYADAGGLDYQEGSGAYAFVVNQRGPSEKEITDEEIYETCNAGLDTLKKIGVLPDGIKEVDSSSYEAVLYSAIDVLEPRNNVAVWKVSLSDGQKNADKANHLIDAYIDGDTGKLYEFYARTLLSWEEIDPDEVIKVWSDYMGLDLPGEYESENPLMEMTPYFKKYVYAGMDGESTVVTVGFYEGINEFFLKVSK